MARAGVGAVMADEYEPMPEEIAVYVERMLASLEEIAAAAPSLKRLTEQLRLARLSAGRLGRLPRGGTAPSPADVADEIAVDLLVLAARAEFLGLAMLAYLIGIAREEAEARSSGYLL